MDIDPINTHQICGSSSIDQRRMNRPNGVIRGSFLYLSGMDSSGEPKTVERILSASLYIDLNFGKIKRLLFLPIF